MEESLISCSQDEICGNITRYRNQQTVAAFAIGMLAAVAIALTVPKQQSLHLSTAHLKNSDSSLRTPLSSSASILNNPVLHIVPTRPAVSIHYGTESGHATTSGALMQQESTRYSTPWTLGALFSATFIVASLGLLLRFITQQKAGNMTRAMTYSMMNTMGEAASDSPADAESAPASEQGLGLKRPVWRPPPPPPPVAPKVEVKDISSATQFTMPSSMTYSFASETLGSATTFAANKTSSLDGSTTLLQPMAPRTNRFTESSRKIIDLQLDLPPIPEPVANSHQKPQPTANAQVPEQPKVHADNEQQVEVKKLDAVIELQRPTLKRPIAPAAEVAKLPLRSPVNQGSNRANFRPPANDRGMQSKERAQGQGWVCSKCQANNFPGRTSCFRCRAGKGATGAESSQPDTAQKFSFKPPEENTAATPLNQATNVDQVTPTHVILDSSMNGSMASAVAETEVKVPVEQLQPEEETGAANAELNLPDVGPPDVAPAPSLQRPLLIRPKLAPPTPRMVINLDDIPDRSAPAKPPAQPSAQPRGRGDGTSQGQGKGRGKGGDGKGKGKGKGGRGSDQQQEQSADGAKAGVKKEAAKPKFAAAPAAKPGKGGKGELRRGKKKDDEPDKTDQLLLKARKKNRLEKRDRLMQERLANAQQKEEIIEVPPEGMSVSELADKLAISPANVVTVLFKKGIMSAPNQMIAFDLVKAVCDEYEVEVLEAEEEDGIASVDDRFVYDEDDDALVRRPPVVTIMGHVDHGKTSLLDYIRKSNVVAGEASGITQAIGAYHVEMPSPDGGEIQRISFIDTPGHEAFTAMRARGATVTDITIIVVAADDGVRPQTKEAIAHCKAAGVPMVVAINKIDKEGADPQRVKNELAQEGLVSEEWGGDTPMVNISAKKGTGIPELLEMVLLTAEVADLRANPDALAEGTVIEAHRDRARGPIATVLVQNGTLRLGDIVVCNGAWGRVRAMVDEHGTSVEETPPSLPVQVLGLDEVPDAGDRFLVYESEKEAREQVFETQQEKKEKNWAALATREMVRSETTADGKAVEVLNVILKTDVSGSCEAIKAALDTLPQQKIELRLIMATPGDITVSDVNLATSTGSIIIGFNVGTFSAAAALIKNIGVKCMTFDVIYDLVDEVKAVMEGRLGDEQVRERCGEAEVKAVFAARDGKKAAGCLVVEGRLVKPGYVEVMRKKKMMFSGQLNQLRRMKDQVKEVAADTECGVTIDEFDEWQEGDRIICYMVITRQRALEVAA